MFGYINTPLFIHVMCNDWFMCLYVFCIDIEAEVQTWMERMWDMSVLFTLCDPCGFDT